MDEFETRNVVLDRQSVRIIEGVVVERGLGVRGFSAALRMIVREWQEQQTAKDTLDDSIAQNYGV